MTGRGLSNALTLGVGIARAVAVLPWPATMDPLLVKGVTGAAVGSTRWFKNRRMKRRARKARKYGYPQSNS